MTSKEDRARAERIAAQVAKENADIAAEKAEKAIADKAQAQAQEQIKRDAEEARRRTNPK